MKPFFRGSNNVFRVVGVSDHLGYWPWETDHYITLIDMTTGLYITTKIATSDCAPTVYKQILAQLAHERG